MKSSLIVAALGFAPLLPVSGTAIAQDFPSKPIRMVIGFPPGGGIDLSARLLGPKLTQYTGQTVVIDNRPGAGTNIANEAVARAAPDGYTILLTTGAVAINMSLYKKLNFDTLRDFAAVSIFASSPHVLVVHASTTARSVSELLALARSQPGKLNYSSGGPGTTQHLTAEQFKTLAKVNITHVPYKGGNPALTALIAGEVQVNFANIKIVGGYIKAGKIRALAQTGRRRSDQMPDIPTMREAGLNMESDVWQGVLAPAATPRPIINRLGDLVVRAANDPEIRKHLIDQGADPIGNSPDEFAKKLKEEVAAWAEVVKASGATAED